MRSAPSPLATPTRGSDRPAEPRYPPSEAAVRRRTLGDKPQEDVPGAIGKTAKPEETPTSKRRESRKRERSRTLSDRQSVVEKSSHHAKARSEEPLGEPRSGRRRRRRRGESWEVIPSRGDLEEEGDREPRGRTHRRSRRTHKVSLGRTEGIVAVGAWAAREEIRDLLNSGVDPREIVAAIDEGKEEGSPLASKLERGKEKRAMKNFFNRPKTPRERSDSRNSRLSSPKRSRTSGGSEAPGLRSVFGFSKPAPLPTSKEAHA